MLRQVQPRPEGFRFSKSEKRSAIADLLLFPGKLAEISLQHLKLNDFIYVSGPLGSYEKLNSAGQPEVIYKVFVQELNYISRVDRNCTTWMLAEPHSEKSLSSPFGARREEMSERLHLWQLFFASPSDWWDNRRSKKNPNSPDFKHKDTKECLWLSTNDPHWVREQLRLYDANKGGGFKRDSINLLASYKWEFKD